MRQPRSLGLALGVASVVVAGACVTRPAASPSASSAPAGTPSPSVVASGTAQPSPEAPVVLWPAPADPMGLAVAAGLEPQPKEYLENHVHAHLDVFVDGKPIQVPAGIGIAIDDPNVRTFNEPGGVAYGGIEFCDRACISPLHTHDQSGILHTESASDVPNTLGEFFVEWDVPLSATCVGDPCLPGPVAVYVDGEPYTGDPAGIQLTDRLQIAVVIGTPPAVIPATADFSRA